MDTRPLGQFLGLLNRVADSEFAEKYGVPSVVQNLLYEGIRRGVRIGDQVGRFARSRFQDIKELLPEQVLKKPQGAQRTLFDLTLTEEQSMMEELLRRFAVDEMRPVARAIERGEVPLEGFLEKVQSLGLALTVIPEALGGAGTERSPVSSLLFAEWLAYGDMGLAMAALSSLGVLNALTEFGSRAQQARILPAFVEEDALYATIAMMEPRARFGPHRLSTTARRRGRGYVLRGEKCLVPLCQQADLFLVFAQLEGVGPRGFLVEPEEMGFSRHPQQDMGLGAAGFGRIELQEVWVEEGALLGEEEVPYDHQRMVDLCRLGICGLAVGTCQAVVDYVIGYGNERIAFGEPITHRQAVAFTIAELATELEGMRLMSWRAASRAEQELPFRRESFLASLQCGEKSMEIGSHGVQLLGGHGFVCEHPVELWYRQLRAIAILEGVYAI